MGIDKILAAAGSFQRRPKPPGVKFLLGPDPYADRHGFELVHVAPNVATITCRVAEWHLNGLGVCHGGVIFTLCDQAQAAACQTIGKEIAMQGNINFIGPARLGDTLSARAEVLHAGRLTFVVSVDVTNQEQRRIAHATFTLARLPDDAPSTAY